MKTKVLVTSPELKTLHFIAGHLAGRRFDVIALTDPHEGLTAVERGGVRIAFVDVDAPDDAGLEMIKRIKELDGTIQVIATTTSARLIQAVAAFRLGASDYILHPTQNPERIDNAIWICLEKFKWWADIFKQVAGQRARPPDEAAEAS